MAESKAVKLKRFQNKRHSLRVQLIEVSVEKEKYGFTYDGIADYFARRDTRKIAHRSRLSAQVRNLEKQIELYDRKINELQQSIG
jgi:hypothetical protein